MLPEELDIALEELEYRLERLRALYEQYFLGIEKIEPSIARKDVDRRFWALRRIQIRNTAKRFKLQTLVQRYNTFQQYWQRTCREIENGTYTRHLLKAQRRFGPADAKTWASKRRFGLLRRGRGDEPEDVADRAASARERAEEDLAELLDSGANPLEEAERAAQAAIESIEGRARTRPPEVNRAPLGALDLDFDLDSAPRVAAPFPAVRRRPAGPVAPPPEPIPAARRGSTPPAVGRVSGGDPDRKTPAVDPPAQPTRPLAPGAPGAAIERSGPTPRAAPPLSPGTGSRGAPLRPGQRASLTAGAPLQRGPVPRPLGRDGTPAPPARAPGRPGAAPPASPGRPEVGAAAVAAPRPRASGWAVLDRKPTKPHGDPSGSQAAGPRSNLSDTRVRELHAQLLEAKRQLNQKASVSMDGLSKTLRATETRLRQKHQGRDVDFRVVVKDGQAVVKPVFRK